MDVFVGMNGGKLAWRKKNYNKENMYSNWKKMSKWSGKYTYTLNTRISVNWRKNVEIFYEYSNIRLKLRVVLSFLANAKCYRALMCHILILLHRSMLVSWLVLCAMLPYLSWLYYLSIWRRKSTFVIFCKYKFPMIRNKKRQSDDVSILAFDCCHFHSI